MTGEKRFQEQAKYAREQATLLRDETAASHWLRIADEYDKLAESAAELERQRREPP